jgi:hypothetical protein
MLKSGVDVETDEDKKTRDEYLQKATDKIFHYLRSSNFDLAVHECYYDLAVGTAALVVKRGTPECPLMFYSIPIDQLAVEQSINGYIESCYRTFGEVRISEIMLMWPNAKLPDWMMQMYQDDPNAVVKNLYEGVVYRVHKRDKPYTLVLWVDNGILLEEDMDSSPWVIFRWNKINNEIMGRGPVMDALPSILSLQEVMRLELTAANFNICKPYMAYSDGVFNPWTFQLTANTVIPVSPNGAGTWPIQAFPDVANPAFMQLTSQDLRQQINKLLYAEPLGPTNAPTRTATELAIRQRNLAEEIGPVFTRLQQEFLSRVIKRVVFVLQELGLLESITINNQDVQIEYQSPLVAAQGQQDVATFTEWYQVQQGVLGEAAVTAINPAAFPQWSATKMNIDPTLVNTPEGIQQMLQAKQNEMNMMQQQAQGGMNGNPGQPGPV